VIRGEGPLAGRSRGRKWSSASPRFPTLLAGRPAILGPFHPRFRAFSTSKSALSTSKSGSSTPFSSDFDLNPRVRSGSFPGVMPPEGCPFRFWDRAVSVGFTRSPVRRWNALFDALRRLRARPCRSPEDAERRGRHSQTILRTPIVRRAPGFGRRRLRDDYRTGCPYGGRDSAISNKTSESLGTPWTHPLYPL
jgi:hypothetical protein